MSTEFKIMLTGAVLFGGWLWSYLFIRQIMYNYIVALPLIKKMRSLKEDLIAVGANRYTTISTVVCCLFAGALLFVVIHFCPNYMIIAFAVGAVVAAVMLIKMVTPRNRAMFNSFCDTYCRFVPDDELRMALYNKKTGPIRTRLKEMAIEGTFVPEFRD